MGILASEQVPFAVQEAMVEVAGKVFWYKRPLCSLLRRSGVPAPAVDRLIHADLSKYQMMRAVLEDLDSLGVSGAARISLRQHQYRHLDRGLNTVRARADAVLVKLRFDGQPHSERSWLQSNASVP